MNLYQSEEEFSRMDFFTQMDFISEIENCSGICEECECRKRYGIDCDAIPDEFGLLKNR